MMPLNDLLQTYKSGHKFTKLQEKVKLFMYIDFIKSTRELKRHSIIQTSRKTSS